MARINLLPWREELRKERQREFLSILGGAAVLVLAIVLYTHVHINGMIEHQERRNEFLTQEIAALDKKIKEIKELDKTKRKLLARMDIIQQLQRSRPRVVHLFDELAKTIPEGVYLTQLSRKGDLLTMRGVAQSNARVSAYMHNLDNSLWLAEPKLGVIETKGKSQDRVSNFTMKVKQVTTSPKETDGAS